MKFLRKLMFWKKQEGVKGFIAKIKKVPKKKMIIWAVVAVVIIGGFFLLRATVLKPQEKKLYQVAIMVRDQENPNKKEDIKTSLKKGDVLMTQRPEHKWSKTEKVSYLIIKMELTEEQKNKLTLADQKEINLKDLSVEEQKMIKEEGREDEPRFEDLRPRLYYVDYKSLLPDFKAIQLLKGQPLDDEVYTWKIVKKKKRLK